MIRARSKYSLPLYLMELVLPLWLRPQWLRASVAQQQPLHVPPWRPDEEHLDHSRKETFIGVRGLMHDEII